MGYVIFWVLMVGGWLFLFSNHNTCCFLLLVALSGNGGRKEGRNKEMKEAIRTQIYYSLVSWSHRIHQLHIVRRVKLPKRVSCGPVS